MKKTGKAVKFHARLEPLVAGGRAALAEVLLERAHSGLDVRNLDAAGAKELLEVLAFARGLGPDVNGVGGGPHHVEAGMDSLDRGLGRAVGGTGQHLLSGVRLCHARVWSKRQADGGGGGVARGVG